MNLSSFEGNSRNGVGSSAMPKQPKDYRPRNMVLSAVEGVHPDVRRGAQIVAERMGVSRQAVEKWINAEEKNPGYFKTRDYQYVMSFCKATGLPPALVTGVVDFDRKKDWQEYPDVKISRVIRAKKHETGTRLN